jgi:non-specific serine/threonine protein kinase
LRERLEATLPLLTGGARDAPARQRSLRDTITWSFDLLSPAEQVLFRRLGVFVGGWTLDAAEVIASVDGDLDVLSGLGSLVDKNLVRLDESGRAPRYRILETVREYALEQLGQDGEEEVAIRRVHAAFFAELAIGAENGLSAGVPADVARIEADLDNLRAALAWMLDTGHTETALRVAASLSEFWTFAGGFLSEGRSWLERALTRGAATSAAPRAAGYYGIAILTLHQGNLVAAREAATAGLTLARSAGDADRTAATAFMLSTVEGSEGRRDKAMALAHEAEAAARAAGNANWIGWSLMLLGAERHAAGDLAGAASALEEALTIFREFQGRWGEADTLERLARTVRAQGDARRAAALHAQALLLRGDVDAAVGAHNELIGLADLAAEAGHLNAAAVLLGASDAQQERSGYGLYRDHSTTRDRAKAVVWAELGAVAFKRAWEQGYALSLVDAIAEALAIASRLSSTRDDETSN